MRFKQLDDWLAWLETLHPQAIELGLERVASVAGELGITPIKAPVITVAGTNGKGSVVAALQATLAEPGPAGVPARVGTYTSPHLQRFNERIALAGEPVADDVLCHALERVDQARLSLASAAQAPPSLTYFEFTTLAALLIFAQAGLDYIVLEVGLGGRLDAVNIVDADVAVITSIALDHEAWLGGDRDAIAREKAGILRPGVPAVIGDLQPPAALLAAVEALAIPAYWATKSEPGQSAQTSHGFTDCAQGLDWQGCSATGDPLRLPGLPAPALAQANWSTALQAAALVVDTLPPAHRIAELMRGTVLLGRQSWHRYHGRPLILDVAHNPAAVQRLAAHLDEYKKSATPGSKIILVFAALADKRIEEMLAELAGVVDQWIFAQLAECPRALEAVRMHRVLQQLPAIPLVQKQTSQKAISVAEAMDYALDASDVDDTLVVCGSFYTVGEALDAIAQQV